eukprot:2020166-Rhodomonas_salina.1
MSRERERERERGYSTRARTASPRSYAGSYTRSYAPSTRCPVLTYALPRAGLEKQRFGAQEEQSPQ